MIRPGPRFVRALLALCAAALLVPLAPELAPLLALALVAAAEPRAAEITVLPDLEAVRRMRARLDQLYLRGLGTRVSPRLGKGRDFDRLREYVTGDDFRDVAWKASAHHGKLITREYRLDRSQEVLVCIDRGHRMAARVAQLTRLDHAVNAAVLIASIADRMEDRMGLLSFADEVSTGIPQGRGAAHLGRVTGVAAHPQPGYPPPHYPALATHPRPPLPGRAPGL